MREAAEYIIGNLNEDGYLVATDDELLEGFLREHLDLPEEDLEEVQTSPEVDVAAGEDPFSDLTDHGSQNGFATPVSHAKAPRRSPILDHPEAGRAQKRLNAALAVVQGLDPVGIAARNLRECLIRQIQAQCTEFETIISERKRTASKVPTRAYVC